MTALLESAPARKSLFRCAACGRRTYRQKPDQQFCSKRCEAFGAVPGTFARPGENKRSTAFPANRRKNASNKINGLQKPKNGGSSFASAPLILLGHDAHSWPNTPKLDRQTRARILWCEVGGVR